MLNPTFVTDPQIVFLASRISTNGKFAEPGLYGGIGAAIYGANIRLQTPPAVPEPPGIRLDDAGGRLA